ncbi:outer membrane protein assembly factor BamD [Aquabacterium sp. OR-4]|uniref:outer membrane protein assembly factor BamD n=1 Tax=Aquabacterium sp. OR-4 TaxID=2978127 RepID=UPI0028C701A7|nr:outer membrane protein assembly factor BamD [Aquabacterium sp. OR-4]MDT7835487.1 outer membrane protein assembly factor BamD [Aquabacterium sp. OR-4]
MKRPAAQALGRSAGTVLLVSMLALAGALSGCSSSPKDDRGSAEKLYADAKDDLRAGSYDAAIKGFEKVEGRAAGTLLAQQALLDMAYAQWKSGERVQAIATLDRFIKLHPSSPAFDYAPYLKGLVNFNDNTGFLSNISRQNVSERDQQASRDAFQSFQQLVEQFPESKYAPDARQRMDYIANALAEYEVHVARYYYRRSAYLAAANRAQLAVREYQGAPALEEALYIMVVSYDRLGLTALRDDAERVMKKNFPDSRHYKDGIRLPEQAWWQFW